MRRLGADPRWTTWLAVTPDRASATGRGLWRSATRLIPQGPGDLGRRMGRTFVCVAGGIMGMSRMGASAVFTRDVLRTMSDAISVRQPAR